MFKKIILYLKHYIAWYKQLRQKYGILTSLGASVYNSKHYNLDGTYK